MMRVFQSILLGTLVLTAFGVVSASRPLVKKRRPNAAAQERVFRPTQLVNAVQALSQCQGPLEELFGDLGLKTGLECNENGTTLLHCACSIGTVDLVRFLLDRQDDAAHLAQTLINNRGETLLHVASSYGNLSVVTLLLDDYHVSVDPETRLSQTPLFLASLEGHDAIVELLLHRGADVNKLDSEGASPLCYATWGGSLPVVTRLVEGGAMINLVSQVNTSPLHNAAFRGHLGVVSYLLVQDGINVNLTTSTLAVPLHEACKYGQHEIIKLLLAFKATLNAQTQDGLTPLHIAAREGHLECVRVLVAQAGIEVNRSTVHLITPLHVACFYGQTGVVRLLLENGATVNAQTQNGVTPLHNAVSEGHVGCVQELLNQNGIELDCVTVEGVTPLHNACFSCSLEVAELLVAKGADLNAQTHEGVTPLMGACQKWKGLFALVEFLIEQGAQVNKQDSLGNTVLHYAASINQKKVVKLLLEKRAKKHVVNNDGHRPRDVAQDSSVRKLLHPVLGGSRNVPRASSSPRLVIKQGRIQVDKRVREVVEEADVLMPVRNSQVVEKPPFIDLTLDDEESRSPVKREKREGEVALLDTPVPAELNAFAPEIEQPEEVPFLVQCLLSAIENGFLDAVKGYIEDQGAPCDFVNTQGQTLLHCAAIAGHTSIVDCLCERGVSINAQDSHGRTAFHYACEANDYDVASLLWGYGCDYTIADAAGKTGWDLATHLNIKAIGKIWD